MLDMGWSARGHPGGNETDGQSWEFSRRKGRVWKDKDMRRTISGQARWPGAAGKGCRETQPPGTMSCRWSWTVNRGFTEGWGHRDTLAGEGRAGKDRAASALPREAGPQLGVPPPDWVSGGGDPPQEFCSSCCGARPPPLPGPLWALGAQDTLGLPSWPTDGQTRTAAHMAPEPGSHTPSC